jgi:UDP-glucuronate 4-epimerase
VLLVLIEERAIDVYNFGKMKRDFTYIDDVIEGVVRVMNKPPTKDSDRPAYKLYNIGNNNPVELQEFDELIHDIGFQLTTSIALGLEKFVQWYREYY